MLVSRSRNWPSWPAALAASAAATICSLSQPGELFPRADEHRGGGDLLEDVLIERGPQGRELGVQGLQLFLVRIGERRAGAHEVLVIAPEQSLRLGVEPERVALLVERRHPREQGGVERDRVGVGRELGCHLALQLLHLGVRVGAVEREEHAARAREQLAGLLERHDRVLEAGRVRVRGDRRRLLTLLRHALLEGGREVLVLDGVEARVVEGQAAFDEQRVVVGHGLVRRERGRGGGGGAESERRGEDEGQCTEGMRSHGSESIARHARDPEAEAPRVLRGWRS